VQDFSVRQPTTVAVVEVVELEQQAQMALSALPAPAAQDHLR
jgi:hypothetical protein